MPASISQFIASFENVRIPDEGATQGPYAKLWFVLWATDHSRMYEDECDPNDKSHCHCHGTTRIRPKLKVKKTFPSTYSIL